MTMRKILAAMCTVISVGVAGSALPAQAQAVQTPQGGPDRPPLKCADYKRNSDGSWAPVREVSVVFPDGTSLTIAPSVSFPAGGSYMGLPLAQQLDAQCSK